MANGSGGSPGAFFVIVVLVVLVSGVLGIRDGRRGRTMAVGWLVLMMGGSGLLSGVSQAADRSVGVVLFIVSAVLCCGSYFAGLGFGKLMRPSEQADLDPAPQPVVAAEALSFAPAAGPAAPAGWHADPQNPGIQYFWDGTQWSHRLVWDGAAWVPG